MKQYGKRKTTHSVAGHQNCSICHPEQDTKAGRHRARKQGKLEIDQQIREKDEPVHVNAT